MTDSSNSLPAFFAHELLLAGDVPFEERRASLLEAARGFLDHHREACHALHGQGASGTQVVNAITAMTDTLMRNLFRCITAEWSAEQRPGTTLIAIGGYGRGELNPRSDIDLMFFCGERARDQAELVSQRMLYLLWDLNLEVGYSVRTARECIQLAGQDLTIRTSLLDARYLVGDEDLFNEFQKQVMQAVLTKNTREFLDAKYEEHKGRLAKYGASVYLLEPNIKESEGGLRDLHSAVWIARVKYKAASLRELVQKSVISEAELEAFAAAYDFLWRIRNELHYQSKRKNDQLHFDKQEAIAAFLGYTSSSKGPAVEQFMQDYYAHASQVEHLAASLISRVMRQEERGGRFFGAFRRRMVGKDFFVYDNELKTVSKRLFEERPVALMEAFAHAKRLGVKLSVELKGQIRANLDQVNDRFRRSREISELFLEMLRVPGGIAATLSDMHHLAFLNRYIPEFERIYCKVQHDAYHIYTVDTHSLFCVEELEKLWLGEFRDSKPVYTKVAEEIEKRELLVLAVLFHDIGKGEGKDHSNRGADMIPTIARRLNLNREDSQRLEFLVRRHLDMAHISQRRDLHDDRLINDFARTMGMSENLRMLFLLTYADIKGVGPDVWTEWKGSLLQELYEKTYDILERGDFYMDLRSERVRNRRRKVMEALGEEFGERPVRELLQAAGTRYILSHRSAEIISHLRLELQRGEATVAVEVSDDPARGFSQVMISTLDVPGLFSMITGVMAANGINILGAQIYTRGNGAALDILHVNNPQGGVIDNPAKWSRVRDELEGVIEGRLKVASLVARRKASGLLPQRQKPRYPDRVEFDTDISREYTVIDIFTHDRVGLLYRITRTLADLGLYIYVAKISTKVDQVADTFYVKDIFGQKISAADKLAEIHRQLLASLEE
jgi:[protein-PII] uridylyltransferase